MSTEDVNQVSSVSSGVQPSGVQSSEVQPSGASPARATPEEVSSPASQGLPIRSSMTDDFSSASPARNAGGSDSGGSSFGESDPEEQQAKNPGEQPAAVVDGQEVQAVGGSAGSAKFGSGISGPVGSTGVGRKPQVGENVYYNRKGSEEFGETDKVEAEVLQINGPTNVNLKVDDRTLSSVEHGQAVGQWIFAEEVSG